MVTKESSVVNVVKMKNNPGGEKIEAILCSPLWFVKLLEKPPEKVRVPKWQLNSKSET